MSQTSCLIQFTNNHYKFFFAGGSALGSPRVSAEDTGRKAAHELLEAIESGGCVDKYIQVGSAPFVKK
jgi:RNA 3'-terminal phosphate cyclase